jgi:hypothetical protein
MLAPDRDLMCCHEQASFAVEEGSLSSIGDILKFVRDRANESRQNSDETETKTVDERPRPIYRLRLKPHRVRFGASMTWAKSDPDHARIRTRSHGL